MIIGAERCRLAQLTAALIYRVFYYTLVTSPLWGAGLAFVIVCHRTGF